MVLLTGAMLHSLAPHYRLIVEENLVLSFRREFGRRGAGVGALGPAKDSTTNQGVVESYYVGNDVQITGTALTIWPELRPK